MKLENNVLILREGEELTIKVEKEVTKDYYKIGLIADPHFDIEDSHNSEYLEDLQNALKYFKNEQVEFIASTGDICQYKDKDLEEFKKSYNSSIPFYTAMGNHDYLRIYNVRDSTHTIPPKYSSAEAMWESNVGVLAGNHTSFGSTYKDHLNFYIEKDNDLYIFISVDYGKSLNRYDVIRAINLLDYNDAYVKQMLNYVADTNYDKSKEKNFDYQFYNPEALIWLKNLVETNKDKRIFLFMHHFLPNGAGDTNDLYKHLRIWPYPTSEAILDKFYSGSNTVCGLTFWFLDKLLRKNLNIICFGGHSHYGAKQQEDIIKRAYNVKQPTGKEVTPLVDSLNTLANGKYDYKVYYTEGHSYAPTAPTIHLPSLAKPVSKNDTALYGASEGAVMEVYKDKIVIKYILFKSEGSSTYTNEVIKEITLYPEDPVIEEPKKGITLKFTNKTGQDIRFSGKFLPYIQEQDEAIDMYLCPPNVVDNYCHWSENPYSLKKEESMEFNITELTHYKAKSGKLTTTTEAIPYGSHFRLQDSSTWPSGIAAIKFGVCAYDRSKKDESTGAAMIHAIPIPESNCLLKEGGVYEIILDKIKDNATLDMTYLNKEYKSSDKYKYVIL